MKNPKSLKTQSSGGSNEQKPSQGRKQSLLVLILGVFAFGAYAKVAIQFLTLEVVEPNALAGSLFWSVCFFSALWSFRESSAWYGALTGFVVWLFITILVSSGGLSAAWRQGTVIVLSVILSVLLVHLLSKKSSFVSIHKQAISVAMSPIVFYSLSYFLVVPINAWLVARQVEGYLLNDEMVRAIRDTRPAEYEGMLVAAKRLAAGGASPDAVAAASRPLAQQVVRKSMPIAPDEAVLAAMRTSTANAKMASEKSGELCYQMLVGSPNPAQVIRSIPEDAIRDAGASFAAVIRGASAQPQAKVNRNDITLLFDEADNRLYRQHGYEEADWNLVLDPNADRAAACRFLLNYYEIILSFDPSDASKMFRSMVPE